MAENGRKRYVFTYLSEYITCMMRARVEQCQKCKKWQKKKIKMEIVNLVPNMKNIRVTLKNNSESRALQPFVPLIAF